MKRLLKLNYMAPFLKKPSKPVKVRKIQDEDRNEVYRSSKWKKLRQAKLMEQPLCEICLARGITKLADSVHHADSFTNYIGSQRLWKAYDPTNLVSVCNQCHSWLHRNGTTRGIDIEKEAKLLDEHLKQ